MARNSRSDTRRLEHPPQVGAADPERRNSPIQSDPAQSFELLREQVGDESAGCYFNDARYSEGAHVLSGSTYYRCERGIWVEAGTGAPVSP
jgi:Protein of unknown function (DUF1496)